MKWNLWNKFLIPTLGTIVIDMSIVTLISFSSTKFVLHCPIENQLERLSAGVSRQIEAWLFDVQAHVEENSQRSEFVAVLLEKSDDRVTSRANGILKAMKEHFGYIHVISPPTGSQTIGDLDNTIILFHYERYSTGIADT